ncbi:unnamed protein product [Penicillium egyptiacum]|uniref:Zn(2)-C6 fungal-type domain-containing protein n=1 Tax=Penicillium egyptiacum TaxID=1303716 RepID=A0A9W4NYZ2_9EURO|nr:unnamed protein product [Penicillium egyptiacum]
MMRVESNGEGKLRAACDRCHELKNRCTRTGGLDSRCDRCERLDIDCVYNTSARMGRPRVSRLSDKSASSGSGSRDSHARRTGKRRAVECEQLHPANQVPVDHVDTAFGVIAGDHLNWDLQLYSSGFAQPHNEDPTGGHAHQACHQACHQAESLRHLYKIGACNFSDSGLGMSENSVPVKTGGNELLRLQCHLSNLVTGASESTTGHQPVLDEVMTACKDLLEMLSDRRLDCGGPGPFASAWHFEGGPCGDQRGPVDPPRINYIAVLQVATSYAYALQLLDLAADNLKTRAGSLALVGIGVFNLTSQPAMSTSAGAYMISNMIQELRYAISLLKPEHEGLAASTRRLPPHASPTSGSQAGTMTNSIQAAVDMVSEVETSLLEKLSRVMNDP